MPTKFQQTRRSFPLMFLYLPVLALCLILAVSLLPGETLTSYRYAFASSSPPGSLRQLTWQEHTEGHSLTRPADADMLLLEGTLEPGKMLLIPCLFGSVTAAEEKAQTNFAGNSCWCLVQSGRFSLRVHMPFRRTLHLRVLDQGQLQQLKGLAWISMGLGVLLLIACLFPGAARPAMLITGIYLLLSSRFLFSTGAFPGWVFTAKLLYFSSCPLAALLAFKHRYRIGNDRTDLLVSFTMAYGICLIYYHFDEFTRWLMIFGTCLQLAILGMALHFGRQNRRAYAPVAYGALVTALTASLGLWLSMTLGLSGNGWLMAWLLTMAVALFLQYLPPPAPKRPSAQIPRAAGRNLYFTDFEGTLKKLGFDEKTIDRIDRKCNTSNRHMQHVAEYTRAICIAMGFSAEKTQQISCAALLHDIGKLEIPDAILFEPGKLTNEAFARLQSHNRLGHDLLQTRDTEFFRLAAQIALQHHERIDGTGYLKLRGEEISLPARIVAVADVFDALTAPRVYKQPWDFETAFSHIIENRGIHFDSKVVDDFLKCKSTIRQIYDSFHHPNEKKEVFPLGYSDYR